MCYEKQAATGARHRLRHLRPHHLRRRPRPLLRLIPTCLSPSGAAANPI